jgi:hypothetical protein
MRVLLRILRALFRPRRPLPEPRPAPLRVPMETPPPSHHPLIVDGMGFFVRASYDEARALQTRVNACLVLRAVGSVRLRGCASRQEAPCAAS